MLSWDREPGRRRRVPPHGPGQLGPADVHVPLQRLRAVQHERRPSRKGGWTPSHYGTQNPPGVSSPISPHHQVHNFMLGLNLNTNVPFSPASGVTHHGPSLEEEVDAVTGMMDAIFLVFLLFYGQIHSFMCVSNSNKRLGVVLYSDYFAHGKASNFTLQASMSALCQQICSSGFNSNKRLSVIA